MFSDKGGYYVFPNGLIFQWGYVLSHNWAPGYGGAFVEFPISFPHKTLSVTVTSIRGACGMDGFNYVHDVTNKSFYGIFEQGPWEGWANGYWFAIGY